jgi:hypothetical protein
MTYRGYLIRKLSDEWIVAGLMPFWVSFPDWHSVKVAIDEITGRLASWTQD